jgi:hypothetical protein
MQPSPPQGQPSKAGRRLGRPSRRGFTQSAEEETSAGDDAPHIECSPRRPHDMPLAARRENSPGHLGYMRALRRSSPFSNWDGGGELWRSDCSSNDSAVHTPRAPTQGFRVHRMRRPADFGADLGMGNYSRSRSVSGVAQSSDQCDDFRQSPFAAGSTSERCTSMPPTGSAKTEEANNERARAQARAIAALQKLFFEEMACGAHDANSAAAAALRRLTEGSQDRGTLAALSAVAENPITQEVHPNVNVACSTFAPRRPSPTRVMSPQRRRPTRVMRVACQS